MMQFLFGLRINQTRGVEVKRFGWASGASKTVKNKSETLVNSKTKVKSWVTMVLAKSRNYCSSSMQN